MKIELIERNHKYYIRKKWGIFTLWWHDSSVNLDGQFVGDGWYFSRQPMSYDLAEHIFAMLYVECIPQPPVVDKVLKTCCTNKIKNSIDN